MIYKNCTKNEEILNEKVHFLCSENYKSHIFQEERKQYGGIEHKWIEY